MLLIYGPAQGGPSEEELEAEMPRWFEYTNQLQEAGVLKAGEALHPAPTASTVRERDGETIVTDGPFAETAEVLGGFYLIDVPDADTAREWAAKVPNVGYGSIEVREVAVFS
jgi:hypothetical protein